MKWRPLWFCLVLLWLCLVLASNGCKKAPSSTRPDLAASTLPRTDEALPRPSSSGSPASAGAAPQAADTFKTPIPERQRNESVPCKQYAALSSSECRAAIQRDKLPVKPAVGKTTGLDTPLQLIGPLNGVSFELPRGLYGFLDCRLVLLLAELAKELQSFGVVAVQVNNTYRPASVLPPKTPPPPPSRTTRATAQKTPPPPASKAPSSPVQKRPPAPTPKRGGKTQAATPPVEPMRLSQHARGLAIDITEFRIKDGRTLNVERDWHGIRGAPPCGPKARVGASDAAATLLREITCAIARAGFCNHLITPNRDEAHENHLHCDIEANASEVTLE